MAALNGRHKKSAAHSEVLKEAVALAFQKEGIKGRGGRSRKLPQFFERELSPGRRVAAKK
jgi:hypothetical protein